MKITGELLARSRAKSRLEKLACFTAGRTGESFGLDFRFTVRRDRHFDDLVHECPPTCRVSLIEPSSRACSRTLCPFLRASMVAFSTEYA